MALIQPTAKIRFNLIDYFRGSLQELRKVSWPTRKETWRNTWLVIGFSLFFAVFLGAIDYGLSQLLEYVLSLIS